MKTNLHVLLFGLCISLLFCNQAFARERDSYSLNDTTLILKEGLRTAFSDSLSISIESLTTSVQYNRNKARVISTDTILIILHGIKEKHLPEIYSLKFQVTTERQACNLVNKNRSINVLEVEILAISEETAKLKIQRSCVNWINKECRFNFMCGTGLGIEVNKKDNSWSGEIISSWAD